MTDMTREELDLLWEAARGGERCGNCGKTFEAHEPVYRFHYRVLLDLAKAPLCEACASPDAYESWHVADCDGCGRPVAERDFRSRRWTVCSWRCRIRTETMQRKAKRQASRLSITCAACGVGFQPRRSGATTCSSACRQWLYRRRRYGKAPVLSYHQSASVTRLLEPAE